MTRTTRRLLLAWALIWLAPGLAGLAALAGSELPLAFEIIMLPAVPLYLLSTRFGAVHATRGLLWDSAHSPPFLNVPGVVVVYLVPAVVVLVWVVRRLRDSDLDRR